MSANPQRYLVSGKGQATHAGKTASLVAAVTGKTIYVQRGVVTVTTAAAGGSGLAKLCDGTTAIVQWDANAVGAYAFDFGDIGYPLTSATALQLIVGGAVTTDATANAAAVGYVI